MVVYPQLCFLMGESRTRRKESSDKYQPPIARARLSEGLRQEGSSLDVVAVVGDVDDGFSDDALA